MRSCQTRNIYRTFSDTGFDGALARIFRKSQGHQLSRVIEFSDRDDDVLLVIEPISHGHTRSDGGQCDRRNHVPRPLIVGPQDGFAGKLPGRSCEK